MRRQQCAQRSPDRGQLLAELAPAALNWPGIAAEGTGWYLSIRLCCRKEAGRRSPSRSLPGAAIATAPVARAASYRQIVVPMTAAIATLTAAVRPAAPPRGPSVRHVRPVPLGRWGRPYPSVTLCIRAIPIRNQIWIRRVTDQAGPFTTCWSASTSTVVRNALPSTKMAEIYEGTNEIQRVVMARQILK